MSKFPKGIYFSPNMLPGKGSADSDENFEDSIACDGCNEVCKLLSFIVKCEKKSYNNTNEHDSQTFPKRIYCSRCVEEFSKTELMNAFTPIHGISTDWWESMQQQIEQRNAVNLFTKAAYEKYGSQKTYRYFRITPGTSRETIMQQFLGSIRRRPGQQLYEHRYSPIDLESSNFRVFVLQPGENEEPVYGELIIKSINDRFSYEALSYSWESAAPLNGINLDGDVFPVRENLHAALVHLRLPSSPRYLWIDALSINQADNADKTHQIEQMRSIYARASQVIIWLGKAEEKSDLAVDLIQKGILVDPSGHEEGIQAFDLGTTTALHAISLTEAESVALGVLLNRRWWTRVWCLQEVAVASQDPLIICGHSSVPWSAFVSITEQVAGHIFPLRPWQERAVQEIRRSCSYVLTRECIQGTSTTMPLSSLLRNTIHLCSSDPRDKIYAVLGLAHKQDRMAIQPDYSKPPSQVFTETMKHILLNELRLDTLSFVRINDGNLCCSRLSIPSWVSDWSLQCNAFQPLWQPGLYNASKRTSAIINISDDPSALCLEGFCLDRIAYISEPIIRHERCNHMEDLGLREIMVELDQFLLNAVEEISLSINPTTDPDTWQRILAISSDPAESDVLWRTLVADRVSTQEGGYFAPAPSICAEQYKMVRNGEENYDIEELFNSKRSSHSIADILEKAYAEAPGVWEPSSADTMKVNFLVLANNLRSEMSVLIGRRLFVTHNAYVGLAREEVKVGDLVTILMGGDIPFLLRERMEESTFQFVGEAYVHGVMYVEAIDGCEGEEKGKQGLKCSHSVKRHFDVLLF
jgi:hypothetical protein